MKINEVYGAMIKEYCNSHKGCSDCFFHTPELENGSCCRVVQELHKAEKAVQNEWKNLRPLC